MMTCAYGALTNFKITPSQFDEMDAPEKAIVIASLEIYTEAIEEARQKA